MGFQNVAVSEVALLMEFAYKKKKYEHFAGTKMANHNIKVTTVSVYLFAIEKYMKRSKKNLTS